MKDEDFMNEFKFNWTITNFATYYHPKLQQSDGNSSLSIHKHQTAS